MCPLNHEGHFDSGDIIEESFELPYYGTKVIYGTQPVTLSRNSVRARAMAMANTTWVFDKGNDKTGTGIKLPNYLQDLSIPYQMTGSLRGIPYCWGGFNGYSTVTEPGGYTYTRFYNASIILSDPNSDKAYTTGNINTSGWVPTTIGVDCSGFASSAYGFTTKASVSHFYNSTDFVDIPWNNLTCMDAIATYTAGEKHIVLYDSTTSDTQITYNVIESTPKSSAGRVVRQLRTKSELISKSYKCIRPQLWSNCSHPSLSSYKYNSTYHWKTCNHCNSIVNRIHHVLVSYIGGARCNICGYDSGAIASIGCSTRDFCSMSIHDDCGKLCFSDINIPPCIVKYCDFEYERKYFV